MFFFPPIDSDVIYGRSQRPLKSQEQNDKLSFPTLSYQQKGIWFIIAISS